MELDTDLCQIRSWRQSDLESLVHHADNRNVWVNLRDGFPHPYTLEDGRRWLNAVCGAHPETNFAIVVDGSAVGAIGIHIQSDVLRKSCEVGYWLSEEYWGRGITTAALRAVTSHVFEHFDICRMFAYVFEWNRPSMRVLEKVGFRCEARLRQSAYKDGKVIDQLLYALLRSEHLQPPAASQDGHIG